MPLPVGHGLAGVALHELQKLKFFERKWQTLIFFVVLANLPDIDFLPGFLMGDPNMYHHGPVHSLGATVLVALVGAWYFSRQYGKFWQYFGTIAAVYYSHLVLDFFNQDLREPLGVMLFWPLNDVHYLASQPIFRAVHKSSDSATFFQSLLTTHNFWVAVRELVIMGPIALGTMLYRAFRLRWRRKKSIQLQLAKVKYMRDRRNGADTSTWPVENVAGRVEDSHAE